MIIENLKLIQNKSNYNCYDFVNNSKYNIGNVKQVSVFFLPKDYLKGLYFTSTFVVMNCICGDFFIAVLDLRKNSSTFNYVETLHLTAESCSSLYIPGGCAYGFLSVKPSVLFLGRTDYANFEQTLFPFAKELAIPWPVLNPIVDKADMSAPIPSEMFIKKPEYFIFGATGFIGSNIVKILKKTGKSFHAGVSRIENYADVLKEVSEIKPKYVICAVGSQPDSNNKAEILQKNLTGQLNVIQACDENKIHCTVFSIGLSTFENKEPTSSNFFEETKLNLENVSKNFSVLVLRLQNIITSTMNSKNFLYRALCKKTATTYQSSYTVMDELFPYIPSLCEQNKTGIYNFVSPGTLSENDILFLYKSIIDPNHSWEVDIAENISKYLNCDKLTSQFSLSHILTSVQSIFKSIC